MSVRTVCAARRAWRTALLVLAGVAALAGAGTAGAQAETRTLKLYHVHLREKTEITYKRDGKYLADGLKKANWALRDWRESKPTNMDPKLLDLMWEAYRQSGSKDYIHVIGGYRSPGTNKMLRSRSSGVAGTSLHMSGKAVDWYLPDVPLKKLRDIGLKMQLGGVGYYPRSGSPFVHYDTGKGRYWPRMSRSELAAVFPKGNTIHLPADGKPLPGYETALASYAKRKGANDIQIASGSGSTGRAGGGRSLLAALFGGGNEEAEDNAEAASGTEDAPARRRNTAPARTPEPEVQVAAAQPAKPATAPVPPARPAVLPAGLPMPDRDSFDASRRPSAAPPAEVPTETAVAALVRVPVPTFAARTPAPAEQPQGLDETLVAALEQAAPTVAAPGQLAYAVPTPSERPPFEAVLRADRAALPTPRMIEPEADLTPEAIIAAAALTDTPAAPPAAAMTLAHAAVPHARPQSAVAALVGRPSAPAAATEVASLEPAALRLPAAAPAPAAPKGGKGGRVAGDPAAAVSRKATARVEKEADVANRRVEIASLITAPERRAVETRFQHPVADDLIRDRPTAVFLRGFAAKSPMPRATQHFEGRAVNFLPVHKID